jgi:hydrogenase maturation factor HypF (carbamoyltransferase family)
VIPYRDLHSLPEDERIKMIGKYCMEGNKVGVILEKDDEKIQRYIRKIQEHYPGVGVIEQVDGPVPSVVTLKFGLKH